MKSILLSCLVVLFCHMIGKLLLFFPVHTLNFFEYSTILNLSRNNFIARNLFREMRYLMQCKNYTCISSANVYSLPWLYNKQYIRFI